MSPQPTLPEYSRFRYGPRLPFRGLRRRAQFAIAWVFGLVARLLPVRASQWAGKWLGRLLYPLASRDRSICAYQLRLAFPAMTEEQRSAIARGCFENLGMTLWEVFAISTMRRDLRRWVGLEGEEDLRKAHAQGRGVILVTGHMANWELLGLAFEQLDIAANAVVRSIENPLLDDLLLRNRESTHLKFFHRGSKESPRRLLQCLREGNVLVVALDHDTVAPGVFVDFFGMPANTPRVAASLALRLGVPIVTGFDRREDGGTHCFRFRRVDYPPELENNAAGVMRVTQLLSDAMEAHIRQYPHQWTWNHRRWKRRAPDPSP
ncbi:MAG: lysophospholipid acyltransferase family protein [bacterium]